MVESHPSGEPGIPEQPQKTSDPLPAPVLLPTTPGVDRSALVPMEVEAALRAALQWTATQPNAEPLWSEVRMTAAELLNGFFRAGLLMGSSAAEAYSVSCDRTTMTQADINSGRLNLVVGIAPTRPAEFVILRISLWAKNP